MNNNNNLNKAKKAKNDEFYTQLDMVEAEMKAYVDYNPDVFRGKTILCPCDDPEWSNFAKHFIDHRHEYGYKKLICTCYNKDGNGKKLVLENGVGNITALNGDGDFRSEEITALLDGVDYIITNPPFSLFREFFAWVMKNEKKFSIIGNAAAIAYKEIFQYIKENKIWIGATIRNGGSRFNVPGDEKLIGIVNARWFTNIPYDFSAYIKALELHTKAYWEERGVKYPKYDNYDAIEVSKTAWIPSDYEGVMGVPITWLDKYCPEQFEIVGMCENEDLYGLKTKKYSTAECKDAYLKKFGKNGTYDLNASGVIIVNGQREKVYQRILIKHKLEQFEIVGIMTGASSDGLVVGTDGKKFSINGKETYSRILIKHKLEQFEIVGCSYEYGASVSSWVENEQ